MKVKLNTNLVPMFSGTYETLWEVIETDDNGKELPVDYDRKEFMRSIIMAYNEHTKDIVEFLAIPLVKSIKFVGSYYSPREYNFSTDSLDFNVMIDKRAMLKALDELANSQKFGKFLIDHYRSRDGFISFTPDNYKELQETILSEGNEFEQAIGASIRFTAKNNINKIESEVLEDWLCNGYYGLDYKIEEPETAENIK